MVVDLLDESLDFVCDYHVGLCQLKLVHIDVTCNLLRTLPISLTRLTTSLATLELDSNPLESPPSEVANKVVRLNCCDGFRLKVCARGLSHILRYLLRKADDQLRVSCIVYFYRKLKASLVSCRSLQKLVS